MANKLDITRATATILVCFLCSTSLWAANPDWTAGIAGNSAPFYNPYTESYFQLFHDRRQSGKWNTAQALAATKYFKGVPGRLAVIDSPETHEFILEKFRLDWEEASVWIGLRYWCGVRMLQWEGQRPFSPREPGTFGVWHSQWSRTGTDSCGMFASGRSGYAPVYYRNIGGSVRWQVTGDGKGFDYFLVEFPTGGE